MIRSTLHSSMRWRLWLAALLPAMLVIVALTVGFADRQSSDLSRMLAERGRATAQQLASMVEFAVFAGDVQQVRQTAQRTMDADPDIQGVAVIPADGRFTVSVGQLPNAWPKGLASVTVEWSDELVVVAPIYLNALNGVSEMDPGAGGEGVSRRGSVVGHVVLVWSLDSLKDRQHELAQWMLALTVLVVFLSGFMSIGMSSSVTRPMVEIERVVQRIGSGKLGARVDVTESGPLAQLATGINEMAERLAAAQDSLQYQVALATEELRRQKDAAEQVARVDALTGVASRRALTERADLEIQRALRYRQPLCVVMVDIDRFKRINDTYGHAVGDLVLVAFAQAISQHIREVDMAGRLGGEEFAVLLPGMGAEEAMTVAEAMRRAVETKELLVGGRPMHFTASFGVAEFDGLELNMAGLLSRADSALYHAKHTGRNKVVFADDAIPAFQDSELPG